VGGGDAEPRGIEDSAWLWVSECGGPGSYWGGGEVGGLESDTGECGVGGGMNWVSESGLGLRSHVIMILQLGTCEDKGEGLARESTGTQSAQVRPVAVGCCQGDPVAFDLPLEDALASCRGSHERG